MADSSPALKETSAISWQSQANNRSTLRAGNLRIQGRRTSIKLEEPMWDALAEVSRREGASIDALCSMINDRRRESTLTAAIRVYLLTYFRSATTEAGHAAAGHGGVKANDKQNQPPVVSFGSAPALSLAKASSSTPSESGPS